MEKALNLMHDCPFRWPFHFLNSLPLFANELCGVIGVLSGEHCGSCQAVVA
jgi:hypothetical protein